MTINLYPNDENYPTPSFNEPVQSPDVDPDAGDLVSASFNADWIPVMMGALDQLMLPSTWEGTDDEKTLALNRVANLKDIIAKASVRTVPAPYWDSDADVDDSAPADDQHWYGYVTDPEAPPGELTFVESAAIWLFTGFVAFATLEVGAAPAVAFHTLAKRWVLAWKRGDVGEVIRVIVDGAEVGRVDTSAAAPGDIVRLSVVGDPANDEHDILLIQAS